MISVEVKTVKLSEIKLNPNNPRTITEKDMTYLVKSLQEFPDMMKMREIVVDETYQVLGGNMRLLGLQKIGAKDCIAKIVKGLTPEQKKEFIIRDNTTHGEWNYDILSSEWDSLPLIEWGVDIPKAWMAEPEEETEVKSMKKITCPECGHIFEI